MSDSYIDVTVFVRKKEVFFSVKGTEIYKYYSGDYDPVYFEVARECKCGAGSINGALLTKPIYDRVEITDYSISVYKGEKCALLDPDKGEVTKMKYDRI